MVSTQFYKKFITDFVREQMVVLGPNLAVDTANRVEGLEVNPRGQVLQIVGESNLVLQTLVHEFSKLSPQLVNYFIHTHFVRFPEIAAEFPERLPKTSFICSLIRPEA